MTKLSSIISEMSALDAATEKNASKSSSRLASFLDKIAEEAEKEDDTEKCPECGKGKEECTCGAKKEGSMNNDTAMKIARAYKQAVLDNEQTQGSTVQVGAKASDGEVVSAGSILYRQRGTKIYPGTNVGMGTDHTLFAKVTGVVKFERKGKDKKQVSVYEA